jgi:hypothetical protein
MRQPGIIWCLCLSLGVGFLLMVGGCTEWTIPACAGMPPRTPCVGACTIPLEPGYTTATVPLSVVIKDAKGTFYCQQIEP